MPSLSILQYRNDQVYEGDAIFSIDGGENWFNQVVEIEIATGTTATLLVRDYVASSDENPVYQGTYFWGWRDGTKTFSRKITMPSTDLEIGANVDLYPKPVNKVVFGDDLTDPRTRVLLDLSSDTLSTADQLPQNITAHNNKGETLTGTAYTYSASETTIIDSLIEETVAGGPSYIESGVTLSAQVDPTNIEADNIRGGVAILGVLGSQTVVEVKNDTLESTDQLLKDVTAHDKTGELLVGTFSADEYMEGSMINYATCTKYHINDNITSQTKGIFTGCTNLKEITGGRNLTSVMSSFLYGCSSLESLYLPSLQSIPAYAFYGCSSLQTVTLPLVSGNLCQYIFQNCSELTSLDLSGLTSLDSYCGRYAFSGCSSLQTLDVSNIETSSSLYFGIQCFLDVPYTCTINYPSIYYIYVNGYASGSGSIYQDPNYQYYAQGTSTQISIYRSVAGGAKSLWHNVSSSITDPDTNITFTYINKNIICIALPAASEEEKQQVINNINISQNENINIEESTEPDYSSMTQEELIEIINQQNERIEELENSGTEEE